MAACCPTSRSRPAVGATAPGSSVKFVTRGALVLTAYAGAAPEFERALTLSPGNANVQWAFAWYAADLGRFDQAISAARRAVSLDPENATPHGALGFVLSYARRYPEALAAYQDFKVLRPESPGVEGAIAQTLLASGQAEQARQVCESPSTFMKLEGDPRYKGFLRKMNLPD